MAALPARYARAACRLRESAACHLFREARSGPTAHLLGLFMAQDGG